jgi:hypothetical protein
MCIIYNKFYGVKFRNTVCREWNGDVEEWVGPSFSGGLARSLDLHTSPLTQPIAGNTINGGRIGRLPHLAEVPEENRGGAEELVQVISHKAGGQPPISTARRFGNHVKVLVYGGIICAKGLRRPKMNSG